VKERKASSGFKFDLDVVDIGHESVEQRSFGPCIENGKNQLDGDGGGNPMEELSIADTIGLPFLDYRPQLGDIFSQRTYFIRTHGF
jgi:hypothetical protein